MRHFSYNTFLDPAFAGRETVLLRHIPVLSICILVLLSAVTTGCGYKDDLYLPAPDKEKAQKQPKKS